MTEFNKPTEVSYVTLADFNEPAKTAQEFYDELRNGVIEEVALHVQNLKSFGNDTTSSLAIYIREMKK
jgi:hypothetical protein